MAYRTERYDEIPQNERVYFNVEYQRNKYARAYGCRFDPGIKLWYTGLKNNRLYVLMSAFHINDKYTWKEAKERAEIIKSEQSKKAANRILDEMDAKRDY